MKKIIIILFLAATAPSLWGQDSASQKYFEGTVEYLIKSESFMQGVSDNELRERTGATLKLYFKNGNYMREYIDGAGYTLKKYFYLSNKNMMYNYDPMAAPDTLYTIDPSEAQYKSFTIEAGNTESVMSCDCPSAVIKARYYLPFLPDTGTVSMTYYFCEKMPVNPDWFNGMYIWKDVIKQHKSISIKFVEDDPFFYRQTFTATKIAWEPVPDEIFRIDPKLILKKMPNPESQ